MANLRANRITSTEVFETTGSVQFDGSGDYLSLADSEDFNFGSGDFTVEGWMYLIGSGEAYLLGQANSTGANSSGCVAVLTDSSNNLVARVFQSGGSYNELTHSVISKAVWNHFALVRSGSTLFLYLNGVSVQISIGSITLNNSTNQFGVGRLGEYNSKYFNGHISNLRILKGTALYTENFTPPTRELEVIPNTVLLCAQSTTNAAEEKTGKTITVNGNAVANELTPGLLTNIVKSGGSSAITGSVEFDGNGDYLSLSSNDFAFGTGDFTLEFWFYDASPTSGVRRWVTSTLGAFGSPTFVIRETSGNITFKGGFQTVAYPKSKSWSHIAYTRENGVEYIFYNGVLLISDSSTRNYTDTTLYIGGYYNVNNTEFTQGFISNLRIIKGTALYTSNFIPLTRKLTKLPGTVLLCCTDSNDPTTEATGKTITGYGDLQKADGVELVTNGTFESNSDWSNYVSPTTSEQSTEQAHSGTYSWKIVADEALDGISQTFSTSSVTRKIYVLSGWLYSSTGYARIRWRNGANGAWLYDQNVGNGTSNVWQFFRIEATETNGGSSMGVRLTANASGTFYFDDISVTQLVTPNRASDFTPSVGSDDSVEFAGPTTINTENYFYLPTGPTEQRGRGRGVIMGGNRHTAPTNPDVNTIFYIDIATQGNAINFGELTNVGGQNACVSSSTRGISSGGNPSTPTYSNIIEFITIATTSNATDFGDLTTGRFAPRGMSSSTRGLFAGGRTPTYINTIDYITIASAGNALDFGDLNTSIHAGQTGSSPTRGIYAGGQPGSSPYVVNIIDFVTIASTGDATDFGDLITDRKGAGSSSSSTRVVMGGGTNPALLQSIEYITIPTTGNSVSFGDLTGSEGRWGMSGMSNSIRGVFAGGYDPSPSTTSLNTMDFVTIASTGNAQDFGDVNGSNGLFFGQSCSDSHGGLG